MRLAETFGENVRRVRLERGMTIEALADEVGLAYTYVGQIERGSRNPTLDVVERVSAALAVEPLKMLTSIHIQDELLNKQPQADGI